MIMKANLPTITLALFALATSPILAADAKDEVTAAAKKLGQENYGWSTTVESGFGQTTSQGKAQKDGLVWLSLKFGENSTEAFLKSADKGAVKMQDEEWQSLSDLTAEGNQGRGRFIGRMLQNYKAPALDVVNIASKTKELKKEGDAYTGDLSEEGAKDLVSFGGRRGTNAPEPKDAKGSVKIWIKDGLVSKFELKLQGTVNFNGEDRDISRTSTVEIKDVGSAKIAVPEAVQKKLS
jgi:hypothetical protein